MQRKASLAHSKARWQVYTAGGKSYHPPACAVARCRPVARSQSRSVTVAAATTTGTYHGVVITGASKGLGFALACEFLAAGDKVVVCGRNEDRLSAAVSALKARSKSGQVHGIRCDVSSREDVAQLAQYSVAKLGTITLWINNAGEVTPNRLLADVDPGDIDRVVGSNVLGSLLCCREAIRIMRAQPPTPKPAYHIFNMGFSRWGASLSKSAVTHKATKMALTQLSTSLAEELRAAGVSSVGVHNLSPGMVLTDLLLRGASPVARRFFNALAEEPADVAAALAPRIRTVQGSGSSIEFLSPGAAIARVLSRAPQIIGGGRFFNAGGARQQEAGAAYSSTGARLLYDFPPDDY